MRAGLDVLLADTSALKGARVGLCCNHTAVTRELVHALPALAKAGVPVRRIFGPEHGVDSTAQDMIAVDDGPTARTDTPAVVSLYGDSEASLHPPDETLADLDVLLFDIQDIGARYYTYQATLGYIMQVAARTGTQVVVLDRPNPIDGLSIEGNVVEPGFESFVSAYPLANRHGMTMGRWGGTSRSSPNRRRPPGRPGRGVGTPPRLDETRRLGVSLAQHAHARNRRDLPGNVSHRRHQPLGGARDDAPLPSGRSPRLDRRASRNSAERGQQTPGSSVAFREATFEPASRSMRARSATGPRSSSPTGAQ